MNVDHGLIRLPSSYVKQVRLNLVCFPAAGSSALTYLSWSRQLPAEIELSALQLPGHFPCEEEALITGLEPLLDYLVDVLLPACRSHEVAFFGHSLGALLAYLVIHRMQERESLGIKHLFVSGSHAPHLLPLPSGLLELSDQEFLVGAYKQFGGFPPEVLADPALAATVLPGLRADAQIAEEYRYTPMTPLDCPITVFCGREDTIAEADLEAWKQHTREDARFRVRRFPGGHFYLFQPMERKAMLLSVVEDLMLDFESR